MALQAVHKTPLSKLNKGTSKDEWGNIRHWTFKSPDGMIRCQLELPQEGKSRLVIKHFTPNMTRYGNKRLSWGDGVHIGSMFIDVDMDDKPTGPVGKDILEEVRSLLDFHDTLVEKHQGRLVRHRYNEDDDFNEAPSTVIGIRLDYTKEGEETLLYQLDTFNHDTTPARPSTEVLNTNAIPYTENFHRARVEKLLAELDKKFTDTGKFLDDARTALENGTRHPKWPDKDESFTYGFKIGFLGRAELDEIQDGLAKLVDSDE